MNWRQLPLVYVVHTSGRHAIMLKSMIRVENDMSFQDDRYIADDSFDASDSIIAKFRVTGSLSMEKMAKEIAAESSVGTWVEIKGLTDDMFERLAARVIDMDTETNSLVIAYPSELFEEGSIPQLLSLVVGNIFGMKIVKHMRLLDLTFPERILKQYPGPELGIEGARKALGIPERNPRPILGTIVKPKMGLPIMEHARVAYEAWYGGVDFVKDDEPQTDQKWIRFEDRISAVLEMSDKVKDETGRRVMYAANITGVMDKMLERADFVKSNAGSNGATCIMVDVLTAGFSALQHVRAQNYGLVIHGHRAMHAVMTHHPKHGIHMAPLAKILRMAGVDTLHAGTVVGKMEGDALDTMRVYDSLRDDRWPLLPALPVASGGLHPGHISPLVELFGMDLLINAGGGVHGHPDGSIAGGKAMRQALDATLANQNPWSFAEQHGCTELKRALEKWNVPKPGDS